MPVTPPDPSVTAARLAPALPQKKFGFLRPFSRDQARDVATATGDTLLQSRVEQVIGSNGEWPWRPNLTANLDRVRNIKEGPALDEFARAYVGQALSTFVPEVIASSVSATRTDRRLVLVVTCTRLADINARPPKTFTARASLPI